MQNKDRSPGGFFFSYVVLPAQHLPLELWSLVGPVGSACFIKDKPSSFRQVLLRGKFPLQRNRVASCWYFELNPTKLAQFLDARLWSPPPGMVTGMDPGRPNPGRVQRAFFVPFTRMALFSDLFTENLWW